MKLGNSKQKWINTMRSERRSGCGLERAFLLLLFLANGCSVRPSTQTTVPLQVEGSVADHEHQHEHFPPHWPGEIFQASERLNGLGRGTLPAKEGLPAMREIADLLKWLPVLAADSDLSREDFYRIDAWSTEWTKHTTQHAEQGGDIGNFPKKEALQEMVDRLIDVCRKEQDRLRAMQPVDPSDEPEPQNGLQ